MLDFCTTNLLCIEELILFFIKTIGKEPPKVVAIFKGASEALTRGYRNVSELLRSNSAFTGIYIILLLFARIFPPNLSEVLWSGSPFTVKDYVWVILGSRFQLLMKGKTGALH